MFLLQPVFRPIFQPGLLHLARQLRILAPRSATDEELQLVHSKAQVAGLKRAQLAAEESDRLVWLPVKGCLETCHEHGENSCAVTMPQEPRCFRGVGELDHHP